MISYIVVFSMAIDDPTITKNLKQTAFTIQLRTKLSYISLTVEAVLWFQLPRCKMSTHLSGGLRSSLARTPQASREPRTNKREWKPL